MVDITRAGRFIYRAGAISNFLATLPAFLFYERYVSLFTDLPPRYPFLVWIWAGMAFLWGVMFWEISADLFAKQPMLKYTYLEKGITSVSVLVAYLIGDIPGTFLLAIVVTDVIWIPLFAWVHAGVARSRDLRSVH
jgi:hypothetical protein